jgi:hypothetical protein
VTPEDREHERNWEHSLEVRRQLERDTAQIALAAAKAKLAAAPPAEPQPLQSMARPAPPEPSVIRRKPCAA